MKYYCKCTELEYNAHPCHHCIADELRTDTTYKDCVFEPIEMPDYETVVQWIARTGRKYPDTAPVYVHCHLHDDPHIWIWELMSYHKANSIDMYVDLPYVVATEAGAPTDNWRPRA